MLVPILKGTVPGFRCFQVKILVKPLLSAFVHAQNAPVKKKDEDNKYRLAEKQFQDLATSTTVNGLSELTVVLITKHTIIFSFHCSEDIVLLAF